MGLTQAHSLGREQRVFIGPEPTAGTLVKAVAANGLRVTESSMTHSVPRENRADARDTRSLVERITRASDNQWSLGSYLLTGLDPGDVRSDLHDLIYAAMGTFTPGAGVSDVYTLSASQVCRTLSMVRQTREGASQEAMIGCAVNQMVASLSQGDEPKFQFSGPALRYAQAMGVGAIPTGAVSDTQTLTDASGLTADAVVAFSDSAGGNIRDNAGAGYRVVSVTDNVVVVEASLTTADNDLVYPFVPAPTVLGTPIAGIIGTLTYDAGALPVKAFTMTVANNITTMTEALESGASDFTMGWRDVTGELTVRARADVLRRFGQRKLFAPRALSIACGAAGNRITFAMPAIEVNTEGELSLPVGNEEGEFTLPFVARVNATGEDELSITID